ncbi:MAG: pyrimidine-nucleoside phosphorylase, partial [Desulfobacteraceae bacterium]|nr:pyrimidine-nucleoside phosphorylase [Desulfobacteraceae bacterium]
GNAIGNALEVQEAIETLQGKHDGDLKTISLSLASKMLIAGKVAMDEKTAFALLEKAISSGKALSKLGQMIKAQGGDPGVCQNTRLLPGARQVIDIKADHMGYIGKIMTSQLGVCALLLGAGRTQKSDKIDHGVGIWMNVRLGDFIEKNDVLAQFYVNDTKNLDQAIQRFKNAIIIKDHPSRKKSLIYDTIT